MIQFGIETEYGITLEGDAEIDVVADSIALVRAATAAGVRMSWDYRLEDPHVDARGFTVDSLRQDADESFYQDADAGRSLSFAEIKSDLALHNGGRLYNNHAHPEYCTPECSTVDELVAHDRAGEEIVMQAAEQLGRERGRAVRIYKNNTDYRGHSYGCHENYLLPRSLPWADLVRGVEAFLVTRQIFAGAGKFAMEDEDRFIAPGFQISQRADFFSVRQSVDTMQRRPLINTRDEPHALPEKWRRFHVILGDANLSPFATRLKIGTLALVLEMLVNEPSVGLPQLEDPLRALKGVSRDRSWRWELPLASGKVTTAIEIQRRYLERVRAVCDLLAADRLWVIQQWERVLDDLECDPMRCRNRLDWVAKHALLGEFAAAEGLDETDPWLLSLDLEYHRLDGEEGLFRGLETAGLIASVPSEEAVRLAHGTPPDSTRVAVRGRLLEKFSDRVRAAQWDHVILAGQSRDITFSLLDLFAPADIGRYLTALEVAETPDELARRGSVWTVGKPD